MTLVLTLNANSIWQAATALHCLPVVSTLAEATNPGQATLVAAPVSLAELTAVIANCEQVLLAYEAPEAAIANLVQLSKADENTAQANNATLLQNVVQQWQQQIRGLLSLQRQYRRKLKLLNLQQLVYASSEQLAELQPYWPLTQSLPAAKVSIEHLAASQLLSQNSALSELNLLLQASSLALTEVPPLDVQAALASVEQTKTQLNEQINQLQHKLVQQQQQAESREAELTQSLMQQLFTVQEELEKHYVYWKNAEDLQRRQHTTSIQQQKQQHREFIKLESKFKKQKVELASLKYCYKQLQSELELMQNSTSWKVAAPIRILTRAVKKVDKNNQRLQQDIGLLFTSEFFDADWYLSTYVDVKNAGINPAEHYLKFGAAEGRRPSAEFDGNWYLQRYPDVAASGVNPLLHYIKFGRNEGRTASPKLLEDHSEHKAE